MKDMFCSSLFGWRRRFYAISRSDRASADDVRGRSEAAVEIHAEIVRRPHLPIDGQASRKADEHRTDRQRGQMRTDPLLRVPAAPGDLHLGSQVKIARHFQTHLGLDLVGAAD